MPRRTPWLPRLSVSCSTLRSPEPVLVCNPGVPAIWSGLWRYLLLDLTSSRTLGKFDADLVFLPRKRPTTTTAHTPREQNMRLEKPAVKEHGHSIRPSSLGWLFFRNMLHFMNWTAVSNCWNLMCRKICQTRLCIPHILCPLASPCKKDLWYLIFSCFTLTLRGRTTT